MAKIKQKQIVIKVPDEQHEKYFQLALNVTNAIRTAQKKPVINLETLALNSLIAGSNQVVEWYVKEQETKQAASEASDKAEVQADASN